MDISSGVTIFTRSWSPVCFKAVYTFFFFSTTAKICVDGVERDKS